MIKWVLFFVEGKAHLIMREYMAKREVIVKKKNKKNHDNIKNITLEHIFKDYKCGSFKTKLIDIGEPRGNEKWW